MRQVNQLIRFEIAELKKEKDTILTKLEDYANRVDLEKDYLNLTYAQLNKDKNSLVSRLSYF